MWPEGGRLDTPGQVSQQNIFMEKGFRRDREIVLKNNLCLF